MKLVYKGFNIDVTREKCLAGYALVYYSVFRKSDGYEVTSGYSDTSDTVRDFIGFMKTRVDVFIADPAEEDLPRKGESDEDYAVRILEHRVQNAKTNA